MDIDEHKAIVAEFKQRLEAKTAELATCQQQRDRLANLLHKLMAIVKIISPYIDDFPDDTNNQTVVDYREAKAALAELDDGFPE
jgi:hypothetical protein